MKGNARKVRRLLRRQGDRRLCRRHRRCLHAVRALRGQAREIRQSHRAPPSSSPRTGAPTAACAGSRRCCGGRPEKTFVISGNGDVIEPDTTSSPSARAAPTPRPRRGRCSRPRPARARDIVERSLNIAADICIYTNRNLTIEELCAAMSQMTPRARSSRSWTSTSSASRPPSARWPSRCATAGGASRCAEPLRARDHAEEHHHDRPDRRRQDRDRPAPGAAGQGALRQGRGHQVHRGRLCRPRRRLDHHAIWSRSPSR